MRIEDPLPQHGRDGSGNGPWHEDCRTDESARLDGLVHDERHDHAEDGFDTDCDKREECRVPERGPESCAGVSGENVDVIVQSNEWLGIVDESCFRIDSLGAEQRLIQSRNRGEQNDD